VSAYPVGRPANDHLWEKLSSVVDPIFERIASKDAESQTLSATRDLLIPKVISGEVRVEDGEMLAGEAT
jgi:type I restriction enzyme, S subunit